MRSEIENSEQQKVLRFTPFYKPPSQNSYNIKLLVQKSLFDFSQIDNASDLFMDKRIGLNG